MEGDNYQILKEWHSLLADGAISQHEFDALKSDLLANNIGTKNINENLIAHALLHANFNVENTEQIVASTPETNPSRDNIEGKHAPKRNRIWAYITLPILIVAGIGIYLSVSKKDTTSKLLPDAVNNTNNSQTVNTYTPPQPPPPKPSLPGIAANFAGYYRGGMQSDYVGGNDNAECRISEDGTVIFHYALNAGNGNKEATERGHIIEEQGNYYFKTNDGYGKYNVHIKPDIIYIGNRSSWEAEMFLNGKKNVEKNSVEKSTTKENDSNNDTKFADDTAEDDRTAEDKIKDLATAENEREIDKIMPYFSENMTQFFDLKNPNLELVKKRYYHFWEITSSSTRRIISVEMQKNEYGNSGSINNQGKYIVTDELEYFGIKSQTTTTKKSKLLYEFDNKNEIIKIDVFK